MEPDKEFIDLLINQNNILDKNIGSTIVRINSDIIVKYGSRVKQEEADIMKYLKEKTSIPIPEVKNIYKKDNITYIVMEYIEGETLENIISNINNKDFEKIMSEIKKYLNELRNIKGNILGSINDGPYNNCLFQNPKPETSFSNINQFNDYWINKVKEIMPNYHILAIKNVLPNNRDIVFSHGDLTTKNIIIKDNKIVSIIDWELAGWYPESWEYFRMLSYSIDNEKWHDSVNKIIKPYYIDYLMYKHIFACLY